MQVIQYFEVSDSFDPEGKGPRKILANFSGEEDAEKYSKGKGNYGKDANVIPRTLIICDGVEDIEQKIHEEKRQRALSKLSEEDKIILELL